jgi:hypothetical protein
VNPGAVYESDFPYVASNSECKTNLRHPYKIDSWAYIGNSDIASVDSIKQAILDYGPVCSAVAVDGAFQAYAGGIFKGTATNVNHAVLLVGWNDAEGGYWILRNSWGAGWGENGYMKIAYGANSVGYAANFIVYKTGQSPPSPPPEEDEDSYGLTLDVIEITNEPSQGYGKIDKPIDQFVSEPGGDKPEWYYRVNFESGDDVAGFQEKNANNGFDWISEYTWVAKRKHDFKSSNSVVKITICLYDRDELGYDVADLNQISQQKIFTGFYNFTTHVLEENTSDPVIKDENKYIIVGDDDNIDFKAKFSFEITEVSDVKKLNYLSHFNINEIFILKFVKNLRSLINSIR